MVFEITDRKTGKTKSFSSAEELRRFEASQISDPSERSRFEKQERDSRQRLLQAEQQAGVSPQAIQRANQQEAGTFQAPLDQTQQQIGGITQQLQLTGQQGDELNALSPEQQLSRLQQLQFQQTQDQQKGFLAGLAQGFFSPIQTTGEIFKEDILGTKARGKTSGEIGERLGVAASAVTSVLAVSKLIKTWQAINAAKLTTAAATKAALQKAATTGLSNEAAAQAARGIVKKGASKVGTIINVSKGGTVRVGAEIATNTVKEKLKYSGIIKYGVGIWALSQLADLAQGVTIGLNSRGDVPQSINILQGEVRKVLKEDPENEIALQVKENLRSYLNEMEYATAGWKKFVPFFGSAKAELKKFEILSKIAIDSDLLTDALIKSEQEAKTKTGEEELDLEIQKQRETLRKLADDFTIETQKQEITRRGQDIEDLKAEMKALAELLKEQDALIRQLGAEARLPSNLNFGLLR